MLEVGGAVGDEGEGQALGEFGQELGGVGEHGVALAAFAAEAAGEVFGEGGVVDTVPGEGAGPGFAAVVGGPGVEALELGGVAGELGPEAFPGADADGLAVGDVVGGVPDLAGAGAG